MARRRHPMPDSARSPEGERIRAPRRGPLVTAIGLVFLAVVITLVIVLPVGPGVSSRRSKEARLLMEQALDMEMEELFSAAAEVYAKVSAEDQVDLELRAEAYGRLGSIYLDKLDRREDALAALQSAYFYSTQVLKKSDLKSKLEAARAGSRSPGASAAPAGTTAVAWIGEDVVTLEEIQYAWDRLRQGQVATVEAMQEFATDYMNSILMAEEARRRDLDRLAPHLIQTRFHERQLLVQALYRSLMPAQEPSEEQIRAFYVSSLDAYREPESIAAEHIIVATAAEAGEVGSRLAAGESFATVAKEASLDRDSLPEGSYLGWLKAGDDFIDSVGMIPGLADRLTRYDEGVTTGPIESARGFHWFHVKDKRGELPLPLEEVRDRVVNDLRRAQFEAAHARLLGELKATMRFDFDQQTIRQALDKTRTSPPGRSSTAPTKATPNEGAEP